MESFLSDRIQAELNSSYIGVGGEEKVKVRRRWLVFLGIATFYVLIPNARLDFTRFNCHDSESYISLARNMVLGRGYTRSLPPAPYVPHKNWPPGVPTLMLPAAALSGQHFNFLLAKLTMSLVGLGGVLAVWGLVSRLTGNPCAADLAGLLTGLNPFYWDFSHQVMGEVPMMAWAFGGLLLIDCTWARRSVRYWEAFGVGLLCGLVMMMKGTSFGLALAPLAYLGGARRSMLTRKSFLIVLVWFGLGFVVSQCIWMLRNQTVSADRYLDSAEQVLMLGRRDMMDPTSDHMSASEMFGNSVSNVKGYAIYHIAQQALPGLWYPPLLDWNGSGFLALPLAVALFLVALRPCWATVGLQLVLFPMVLLTVTLSVGWAPRYWTPVALYLVLILVIQFGSRVRNQGRKIAVVGLLLAVNLGIYVLQHEAQPYSKYGPWSELAELFDKAAELQLQDANVLTPNPNAFQLVTSFSATDSKLIDDARYTHIVLRTDVAGAAEPDGSHIILAVQPLILVELPATMPGRELTRRYKSRLSMDTNAAPSL
jgi:hypothetical protein